MLHLKIGFKNEKRVYARVFPWWIVLPIILSFDTQSVIMLNSTYSGD